MIVCPWYSISLISKLSDQKQMPTQVPHHTGVRILVRKEGVALYHQLPFSPNFCPTYFEANYLPRNVLWACVRRTFCFSVKVCWYWFNKLWQVFYTITPIKSSKIIRKSWVHGETRSEAKESKWNLSPGLAYLLTSAFAAGTYMILYQSQNDVLSVTSSEHEDLFGWILNICFV